MLTEAGELWWSVVDLWSVQVDAVAFIKIAGSSGHGGSARKTKKREGQG